MITMHIHLKDGLAFLYRNSAQGAVKIDKIDTLGRSYFLDKARVWDAVRTMSPILEAETVNVDGSGKGALQTLSGRVFGHPEAVDGSRIQTSAITAFHLANGECVKTDFSERQTPGYLRILRDVVEGRSPL